MSLTKEYFTQEETEAKNYVCNLCQKTFVAPATGTTSHLCMGVDHGGTGGTSPPRIWSGGTLIQIVPPPRFRHIGTKKSVLWPSKYAEIAFSAGAPPRTPLGELTTLPQTLVGWRGDTPPHMPPHSTRTHLRHSPCVPQKSRQIYAYALVDSPVSQTP